MPKITRITRAHHRLEAEIRLDDGREYSDLYCLYSSRTFRGAFPSLPHDLQFLLTLHMDHYVFLMFWRESTDDTLRLEPRLVCFSHLHSECAENLGIRFGHLQMRREAGREPDVPESLDLDMVMERVRLDRKFKPPPAPVVPVPVVIDNPFESLVLTLLCCLGVICLTAFAVFVAFKGLTWLEYWSR